MVCPIGCESSVKLAEGDDRIVEAVSGNACPKGFDWARQELEHPMRVLTTSLSVRDADILITKPVSRR